MGCNHQGKKMLELCTRTRAQTGGGARNLAACKRVETATRAITVPKAADYVQMKIARIARNKAPSKTAVRRRSCITQRRYNKVSDLVSYVFVWSHTTLARSEDDRTRISPVQEP